MLVKLLHKFHFRRHEIRFSMNEVVVFFEMKYSLGFSFLSKQSQFLSRVGPQQEGHSQQQSNFEFDDDNQLKVEPNKDVEHQILCVLNPIHFWTWTHSVFHCK